jgi:hypothetical protein
MMNLPELFMFAFGWLFMMNLHEEPYNTMLCWLNEEHWCSTPCCLYAVVCCCFVWYDADEHMSCHAN